MGYASCGLGWVMPHVMGLAVAFAALITRDRWCPLLSLDDITYVPLTLSREIK